MLQEQIQEKLKEAMKARDAVRLSVLRSFVADFTNTLVASKRKPTETLTDEEVVEIIQKNAKRRKDSIEQFIQGGRNDLVNEEKLELDIVNEFLPELMSEEEIKKIVDAKKAELGIQDKTGLGKFMGVIMKELKGKADSALVKKVVEESLG